MNTKVTIRTINFLTLASIMLCAGCSTSPLYNESRDKQGQALKKAASELKLLATIEAMESKFVALGKLEADVHEKRLMTTRDFEIAQVAMSSQSTDSPKTIRALYVEPLIERRLKTLLGNEHVPALADMANLNRGHAEDEGRKQLIASRLRTFNSTSGLRIENCEAATLVSIRDPNKKTIAITPDVLATISQSRRSASLAMLQSLLDTCDQQTKVPRIEAKGGVLQSIDDQLVKDRKRLDQYKKDLRDKKQQLAKELAQYATAIAKTVPNETGYLQKLSEIATKLERWISSLRETAKSNAMPHAEAIEKLEALEVLLSALASGNSDMGKLNVDERKAVMIVRLIPSIADEVDKLFKESQKPRLAPLLLAKEHIRLTVDAFQAHVQLLQRRIDALEKQRAAIAAEARVLFRARLALADKSANVDLNRTLSNVIETGPAPVKYRLLVSLAHYFDDAYYHRRIGELLQLDIDAMSYDDQIQQSKAAALMWENLLTNMASVLSDFHAAGIKPSDIAEFLKAFGLIHIGNQVSK